MSPILRKVHAQLQIFPNCKTIAIRKYVCYAYARSSLTPSSLLFHCTISTYLGGSMSSNFGLFALSRVFKESAPEIRDRIIGIYALLIGYNVLIWLLALIVFGRMPELLLLAVTAYTFGLRHAFDADHISAIDNVTRKLMQRGKRPVGVGLFFSLGHSTIVVLVSVAIALATTALAGRFADFKVVGGVIGTSVSVMFLFLVAAANCIILCSVYRTFQRVRRGGDYVE